MSTSQVYAASPRSGSDNDENEPLQRPGCHVCNASFRFALRPAGPGPRRRAPRSRRTGGYFLNIGERSQETQEPSWSATFG